MGRFFDEHKRQKVYSLCGAWDFCIDPDNVGENENWFIKLPKSKKVTVLQYGTLSSVCSSTQALLGIKRNFTARKEE